MSRYKIIDFMKRGNMLVSRDEDEAIAVAIVFEQLLHQTTITAEMDRHIVDEMEQCGQVIFYYEDEVVFVSMNHLDGKLVPVNPFSYKNVELHKDYSFMELVETAMTYGSQLDELEAMEDSVFSEDMEAVLSDFLSANSDVDEAVLKEQLETMIQHVTKTPPSKRFEYEVEIHSLKDLLEEVYGNVNTGMQKQRS